MRGLSVAGGGVPVEGVFFAPPPGKGREARVPTVLRERGGYENQYIIQVISSFENKK